MMSSLSAQSVKMDSGNVKRLIVIINEDFGPQLSGSLVLDERVNPNRPFEIAIENLTSMADFANAIAVALSLEVVDQGKGVYLLRPKE